MKQRHLYSLLDQSFTTVLVTLVHEPVNYQAPAASAPPPPGQRGKPPLPWAGEAQYTSKTYTYKVPRDWTIAVDDYLVVHRDTSGLHIVRVVRVDAEPQIDIDASFDYKWAVQKLDLTTYQARIEAERTFADAMLQVERVRQRELMISGFHNNLPADSEARKLFDQTVGRLKAPTVDHEEMMGDTAPSSQKA